MNDLSPIELAGAVSLGLIAMAIVAFAIYAARTRGPGDTFALACLRAIASIYARVFHRVKRIGPGEDPFPPAGPSILVSNHRSGVDPVILSVMTKRRIRFLMAREYFELPILRRMFQAIGCIPVNRDGNDLGATKAAFKALRAGHVIGIFPQGGIQEAGISLEGKSGVALLALRTGAPVVPFHIEGSPNTDSILRAVLTPSRITVTHGEALRFGETRERKPGRGELERVTAKILDAVAALGEGNGGEGDGRGVTGISESSGRSRACGPCDPEAL